MDTVLTPGRSTHLRKQERLLVGVDDSCTSLRLALPNGDLVQVAPARPATLEDSRTRNLPMHRFETDGAPYALVDDPTGTKPISGNTRDAAHRVLVHHALTSAGLGGRVLQIATLLPAQDYFSGSGGRPNATLVEKAAANMVTPVRALSGVPCAEVVASFVFAPGACAWIDYAIDSTGRAVQTLGAPVVVIDIGEARTDCMTILPGFRLDAGRSGSVDIGVFDLLNGIAQAIRLKFRVDDVPLAEVRQALESGYANLQGRAFDVRALVAEIAAASARHILLEAERRCGAAQEFQKILFVGPGAHLLPALRTSHPNADVSASPAFANARGLLKYMRHIL